jgi:hypothetical protein
VEEPSTVVTLARTLQAILKITELTTTNRALRANWETRQDKIFTLVRDIVTAESSEYWPSFGYRIPVLK